MGAYHKSEQESLRDAVLRLKSERSDAHWQWLCDQLALAAEVSAEPVSDPARVAHALGERGVDTSSGVIAGLAHHFNNTLMGILGASRMASRSLEATDPARPYVDEITAQAEQGVALSARLLDIGQRAKAPSSEACSCASAENTASPRAEAASAPERTTSLLLVEDERLIRITLKHELQSLGYQVECAADGHEASRLIQARREPLDLLLTDVVVPGPTGPEIAKLVRAKWPTTRVVFMSAYPRDVLIQKGHIQAGQVTLEKPFTEEQLVGTLRAALHGV